MQFISPSRISHHPPPSPPPPSSQSLPREMEVTAAAPATPFRGPVTLRNLPIGFSPPLLLAAPEARDVLLDGAEGNQHGYHSVGGKSVKSHRLRRIRFYRFRDRSASRPERTGFRANLTIGNLVRRLINMESI